MPKIKTHRGMAKRVVKRAAGSYRYRRANRNHILTKKSQKRKRHLRKNSIIKLCDHKAVRQMLGE